MKKIIAVSFVMIALVSIIACSRNPSVDKPKLIGVSMPARASERWVKEGEIIKSLFEQKGYQVDVQFAENNVQTQISQLENMITSGASCLVVTPVDDTALNNVLQIATDQNIPVVAYDRLIMNTQNVSYFVTFDNVKVGENSVKEVFKRLNVDSRSDSINIEIFTGDSADQNSYTFYEGVMNILQPYLDSGKVKILSGQVEFDQISIANWSQENALKRMENLLSGYYSTGTMINAIIGPADIFAYAYVSALEAAGYKAGTPAWPITTGQDCEKMAVINILNDKQTFSNWRDGRVEAAHLLDLVDAVLTRTTPETNKNFDNGVKQVPSYVCDATIVDKINVRQELIDGGYYTAAELGL
jgi:putative multiple sugar transport system substrate-binding protein